MIFSSIFDLSLLKFTKFCEISTLLLTGTTQDKSKVKILQNFVAFSEYMNFKKMVTLIMQWTVKMEVDHIIFFYFYSFFWI